MGMFENKVVLITGSGRVISGSNILVDCAKMCT